MQDTERYKLLFGPYQPPRTRIGDELTDAIIGPMTVTGWSQGTIAWPLSKGAGRAAFILTGDLVEAVKNESSQAIQHWWGVSPSTVQRWRKALGVSPYTAGTLRLHREWKPEIISAAALRRGQCKGISPAARAKMTAKFWARGYARHSQRVWTKAEEAILGTMSDTAAARQLGRTPKVVGMWRQRLGIPAFNTRQAQFSSKSTIPLEAAKVTQRRLELGLSQKAIAQRAGMDQNHLSQLESSFWRRMKPATMQRLATALQCRVADLSSAEYQAAV